jgi:hypothetical protein
MTDAIGHAAAQIASVAYDLAHNIAQYHATFSAALKPSLKKDGDMWCALLGDNLQEGVSGFGSTPARALAAFDTAMCCENGTHTIERTK